MPDFLNGDELAAVGFGSLGRGVLISRNAVLLSPHLIHVGDQSRIDAFCVLSAGSDGLRIGRNVHVSAHVSMLGRAAIEVGDFTTISVRCSLFSSNDDYSGRSMANPTLPSQFRQSVDAPIRIKEHAIVGSTCVVLPGVTIGESAAIGAFSLVKQDVPAFAIVAGVPARLVGERRREHRDLAEIFLREQA